MVQAEFGPGVDLAKRLRKLEDGVQSLATRDVLQNASIGPAGVLMVAGQIHFTTGSSLTLDTGATLTIGSFTGGAAALTGLTVNGDETVTGNSNLTTVYASSAQTTGDVYTGGRVTSAGSPFTSLPSYNYQVTTGYKAVWINSDGQIGYSASTRAVKKDLEPFPAELADNLLNVTPYLGRYTWDDESTPLRVFLIAEDMQDAGFGPDVVPTDADGNPETVNYSQVVVPLLAAVKSLQAQVTVLQDRLTAAGIA